MKNDWKKKGKCSTDPFTQEMLFRKDENGKPDPIDVFHEKAYEKTAKRICEGCSVKLECLREGMAHVKQLDGMEWGVMGGTTHRQRAHLYSRQQSKLRQISKQLTELLPDSDIPTAS